MMMIKKQYMVPIQSWVTYKLTTLPITYREFPVNFAIVNRRITSQYYFL